MINWTSVNVSSGGNCDNSDNGRSDGDDRVKIVSHERVEDTNPETYVERGKCFFEQSKFKDAEREYLKAVKFSGKEKNYIVQLIKFYYATCRDEYKKKADRLYKELHINLWYIRRCVICGILAYAGLSGQSIFVALACIPFVLSGFIFMLNPKSGFIHSARHKEGVYTLKVCGTGFLFVIMTVALAFAGYNGGKFFDKLYEIGESPAVIYGGLAIGGVALIIGITYFNKVITEYQKGMKENGFFHKCSKAVRVIGTVLGILFALVLVEEIDFDDINQHKKTDSDNLLLDYKDYYDDYSDYEDYNDYDEKDMTDYFDYSEEISEPVYEEEISYWDIDLDIIYQAMNNSYSVNDVEKIFNQDAFFKTDYVDTIRNEFYAKLGNVTGVLFYWENNEDEYNMFSWSSDEPVSERQLINLLDITPGSEIVDSQQKFTWNDLMELYVCYYDTYTYINFNIIRDANLEQGQHTEYMSLSQDKQKKIIADYVGCEENELIFYREDIIDNKEAVMYEYVDYFGNSSDYMIVLFEDGSIRGYYPDGTFRDVEKEFN